jgi:hypothetical protein
MCALFPKAWLTALCLIPPKRNWLRPTPRIKTRKASDLGGALGGREEPGETALYGLPSE